MDFDWEGAGDGLTYQNGDDEEARWNVKQAPPTYVKRTLSNGLPVPVYPRGQNDDYEEDDDDTLTSYYTSRSHSVHRRERLPPHGSTRKRSQTWTSPSAVLSDPNRKKSLEEFMAEFLRCPICNDIFMEATSTNCGHKFCKDCIDHWRREKPLCPICSTIITSTHRLYSDDQMIESQIEYMSPDLKFRYRTAQKKRVDSLLEERKSQTVVKRIRRRLDDSLTFLRSKNKAAVMGGLKQFWGSTIDRIKETKFGVLTGIMIGALLTLLITSINVNVEVPKPNVNFARYAWLAAKKYNGSIPEEWLQEPQVPDQGNGAEETKANVEGKSFLENILDLIYFY